MRRSRQSRFSRLERLLIAACMSLCAAAASGGSSACYSATEIVVSIKGDLPCETVQSRSVAISTSGDTIAASSTLCNSGSAADDNNHDFGSLVIVPSDARDAQVPIAVVIGIDRSTEECVRAAAESRNGGSTNTNSSSIAGCLISRRQTSFLEHETLRLPIRLDQACIGVDCGAASTCERGRCIAVDQCGEQGCIPPSPPVTLADGATTGPDGAPLPPDASAGCAALRADCDGDRENGCEANLRSPATCGTCERNCDAQNGGTCSSEGACEPVTLATGLDNPTAIVVTESEAYVTSDLAANGAVLRAALFNSASKTAEVIAPNLAHPNALFVQGQDLFYGDEQEGVTRCERPGCTTKTLVCAEGTHSIAVVGTDIYDASAFNFFIGHCTAATSTVTTFATTISDPTILALDPTGTALFFGLTASAFGATGGFDQCATPDGCPLMTRSPLLLTTATSNPVSLAVDATYLYWTDTIAPNVFRTENNFSVKGPPQVIATGIRPTNIVLDGPNLYYVDEGGPGGADGSIHRVGSDGTGVDVVLATKQPRPSHLALGPSADPVKRIFWTNRGGLTGAPATGDVRFVAR